MINKEEVKHIAKLARLELAEEEIEKMQKDLSSILDYFEILKKATNTTRGAKETSAENVVRKDEAKEKPATLANNLVKAAPDKKDGYIKVKSIF